MKWAISVNGRLTNELFEVDTLEEAVQHVKTLYPKDKTRSPIELEEIFRLAGLIEHAESEAATAQ